MKTLKQKIAAAAAGLAALGAVQAFTTPAEAQVGVVVGAPGPSPYFWGGRNYCWYGGGWHGPGFYWCGYAWRRGGGWGGPGGWHGWWYGRPGWHGGWRGGYHGGWHGGWHGGYHGGGHWHH